MTPAIKKEFTRTLSNSHSSTELVKGDVVTYTHDYGMVFKGLVILGFHHKDRAICKRLTDKVVYLDKTAWWAPVSISSLTKE